MPERWRRLLFAFLVAATGVSGALVSAPKLAANVGRAAELRELSVTRRREEMFGPYATSLRAIRQRIPETTRVAIVMADLSDREPGIFANTYLYPRESLLYWGLHAWETHLFEGAVRIRPRPATIVWFNDEVTPEARIMTPDEIRKELEAP